MNVLQPFLDAPIAHRTLHDITRGVPENSWEGLDAALAKGLPIEIDIQFSKDGVPMVFHDYDLDRLTGESGWIADFISDDLGKIPLRYGVHGIPRLDEFMRRVNGDIPVLIELKDQSDDLGVANSGMEQAVCEILHNYNGACAVMSFNPHMIYRCQGYAPNIPRGLVTDPFGADDWPEVLQERRNELAQILDYSKAGCCFLSHNRADLNSARLAEVKQKGATIFCWTVRSREQEVEAMQIAHNITFEGYQPDNTV